MSEGHKDIFEESKPNATSVEVKSTVSSPVVRNTQNMPERTVTSTLESFKTSEKDKPALKHHLEQVFITPPFGKMN
ncbi:hypothetical protein RUM44_007386 [Polyplax serrata]|uniref:Uncharacterized protein n=1 Tax=Polyplax serrata TaxID=468196 RepID=A0ABR1B0H8_POLSC